MLAPNPAEVNCNYEAGGDHAFSATKMKGGLMEAHCKKCGRPLHDPVSVARGMGPKCAGIASTGKGFRSSQRLTNGTVYPSCGESHANANLFSILEEHQNGMSEILKQFPRDLVGLVLSAPAAGSIAARIQVYSRHKQGPNGVRPITLLKQIRKMCIEFRLLFWPGLSMNLEPIACIPYGQDDWKIGENGRTLSKDELVAYLIRYGMISQEQVPAPSEAPVPRLAQQ